MSGALELLRERGALTDLDWHFARTVTRIGHDQRPAVLLAAALASRAVGHGHVCLDLPRLIAGGALVDDAGAPIECPWPAFDEWAAALRESPLVGADGGEAAAAPLVLDASGRLYLRRYWRYQTRLAAAIRMRAGQDEAGIDETRLAEGLARLFPDQGSAVADATAPASECSVDSAAVDWQRVAALVAVLRRFCVISGGPGTGKTHTVVRILALLVEQALGAGRPAPRMTLLAPTGKAAARLSESIRGGKIDLPCSAAVVAAIPDDAATIHRGLGAMPGRSAQFRHGADNPLVTDVVLVDEASMVDLALMARLVDAMPPSARLILLGDQDQLASVEAGAVLGDICNSGVARAFSRRFAERIAARLDVAVPHAAAAPSAGSMADCIVELTRSYRYRTDGGIGRLARAINAGDVDGVFAALAGGGGVSRIDPSPDGALGAALEHAVLNGFAAYLQQTDPVERLRALGRFRVLCAHRRGPFGVETVNAQIEALLADRGRIRPDAEFYDGRPILITRNDYQLQLFNGDVGTVVEGDRPGTAAVVFLGPDGAPRRIAPSRLPPHETVFAMSIHKSQGSEFDDVAVLLPEQPSPIVSRELLYTAMTRAREQATVYASCAIVAHAVTQRIERASGLRDALWRV